MNHLLSEVKTFLSDADFPWAICGGFALELYLNQTTRQHGDIDLCVYEEDRSKICRYMLERGWNVYEFRGQGLMRPLNQMTTSDPGRNLMCMTDDCDLVDFFESPEPGLCYHQFHHTGIRSLSYLEFLFNERNPRYFLFPHLSGIQHNIENAILYQDELPYLAPEIVLLYKSMNAEKESNQMDFTSVYPALHPKQKEWLKQNLTLLYPNGHPWN